MINNKKFKSFRYNASPLHIAVFYSHVNIVKMFVEMGAPVNIKDSENRDILKCAEIAASIVHDSTGDGNIDPHLAVRLQRARCVLEIVQNAIQMSTEDVVKAISKSNPTFRRNNEHDETKTSPLSSKIEMIQMENTRKRKMYVYFFLPHARAIRKPPHIHITTTTTTTGTNTNVISGPSEQVTGDN